MLSVKCDRRKVILRKTAGTKPTREVAKERKARNVKKGACHNCNEVGRLARERPKKKDTNNASLSGGGDVYCLTYTDDQSQWTMMLAEVGHIREQLSNIKWLVDSGAACLAWPCKVKPGSSQGGTFLTATGAPIGSQGTTEVKFPAG